MSSNCSGPCFGLSDRKSTRLNSSHLAISYAVFCLKKNQALPVSRGACPAAARRVNLRGGGGCGVQAHEPLRLGPGELRPARPIPARSLFFNDTATTEIYPLSLHDALPI